MNNNSSKNILGNKVNKLFPNLANNKNGPPSNSRRIIKIVLSVLLLLIILIILYIVVKRTIEYFQLDCTNKVNYFSYLFGRSPQICGTIEIINITDQDPSKEAPKDHPKESHQVQDNIINEIENVFHHDEVFHIGNQDFTYDQAKCKCKAYNARLARKDEVVDAYNKGANWCSYGWSEGQNAFYPVQKCYWDNMQEENSRIEDPNKKRYCGMAGVNGGYFDNPNLKFGVNCYGKKPQGEVVQPKRPECPHKEKDFCTLSNNEFSSMKLDTDMITGFNDTKWNM
jgi:hypothetical protein